MPGRVLPCVIVTTLLSVAGAPARAQAPGEVAPLAPAPAVAPRNPSTALALSLGVTLGGLGVMLAAGSARDSTLGWLGFSMMYVGPATGHWYAGEIGGAGLALRGIAVVGAGTAIVLAIGADGCDSSCSNDDGFITGLLIASGALWIGSTIYDIATAPHAARSWNRDHGVALGPTAMRAANGRAAPGVAFALRF